MNNIPSINKIVDTIKENFINNIVCASLSYKPNYRYYWIRDSALVYRCLIDIYCNIDKSKQSESKVILEDLIIYLENETKIQNLNTLTGIGEPKVNIDYTPFNDSWGRPQNDGPPLRGLNMIKLYKLMKSKKYQKLCDNIIIPIIKKDLDYICKNYKKPCFDLWEEFYGWHFYTRVVQYKFIKESIKFLKNNSIYLEIIENLTHIQNELINDINDHCDYSIISSFNEEGNIIKKNDTSIILALCHTDFEIDIINLFGIDRFIKVSKELVDYFKTKYSNLNANMIGRYENDKYYQGHIWILCSLGLAQFYQYLRIDEEEKKILEYVLNIDDKLILAEQYDHDNKIQLSAEKLTWNYSELYFTLKKYY